MGPNAMTRGYDFYGAEVSYFSGKVRAYLRYKRIPFSEITPTRGMAGSFSHSSA